MQSTTVTRERRSSARPSHLEPRTTGRCGRPAAAGVVLALAAVALAGCAGKARTLEITATVLYEKPRIESVSHTVSDERADGGTTVVTVALTGDPGLRATFDIVPGLVARASLQEAEDGAYVGQFRLPRETLGGPYTVVGRLEHGRAGSVTLRDPRPITITLVESWSR